MTTTKKPAKATAKTSNSVEASAPAEAAAKKSTPGKSAAKKPVKAAVPSTPTTRAARVKLCCFDVDGSLTDGRLSLDANGLEHKAFHVHDGQGLRLLEDNGITVALVTARNSQAAVARGFELGLQHVYIGVKDKLACVSHLAKTLELDLDEVAFFGDDLPDLRVFASVGLAAAPANAHPWVLPHAHWTSPLAGGAGAARSFCDFVLEAKGLKDKIIAGFLP